MSEQTQQNFRGFASPMDIVDRTDIAYETRLAHLQDWAATLEREDAPEDARDAVSAAIDALEVGAEVQDDGPTQTPDHGYGVADPDPSGDRENGSDQRGRQTTGASKA